MGHPRSDAESSYLESQIGKSWRRLLSNGQIFNRFADFTAQESKIDRDKIVKRLRVFASREEAPTAFWVVLMARFYEEGAHLGLRKYVEDGVTYHCPPRTFMDFKALCQSTPSWEDTLSWVFRPDYLSGRIFAHVFCPGKKECFKPEWPTALVLGGERVLVTYYPAGALDPLLDDDPEEDFEEGLEAYRHAHSLLCLMFGTNSFAAFDISLDRYASECILGVVSDPYLGASSPRFGDAALQVAALCLEDGKHLENHPLKTVVLDVLTGLKRDYPQLKSGMEEDTDYMYPTTYHLMPLGKKGSYASITADFEAAMKAVFIEHAEEIETFAKRLEGEDHSLHLNRERQPLDEREAYPVEMVRQYLDAVHTEQSMAVEALDTLLSVSDKLVGRPADIVDVPDLKDLVREHAGRLTEYVENTGEFPVSEPLVVALIEVGQVFNELGGTDYGDLLYRTSPDRPWLRTPVKFAGGADDLEDTRNEFLAYCRIVTGK